MEQPMIQNEALRFQALDAIRQRRKLDDIHHAVRIRMGKALALNGFHEALRASGITGLRVIDSDRAMAFVGPVKLYALALPGEDGKYDLIGEPNWIDDTDDFGEIVNLPIEPTHIHNLADLGALIERTEALESLNFSAYQTRPVPHESDCEPVPARPDRFDLLTLSELNLERTPFKIHGSPCAFPGEGVLVLIERFNGPKE